MAWYDPLVDAEEWTLGAFEDAGEWVGEGVSDLGAEITGEAGRKRANKRSDFIVGNMMDRLKGYDLEADDMFLGDPALAEAYADPEFVASMKSALSGLQQMGTQGLTPQDRYRQRMLFAEENQRERAQREAIQQQMAARGRGGSGADYAAQLMNQQGAAQRASARGMGVEEMAQRRALQALQAQGQLAGQGRGQSFQEEATRRAALDDVERANVTHRRDARKTYRQDEKDAVALRLGQYAQNQQAANQQQGAVAGALATVLGGL